MEYPRMKYAQERREWVNMVNDLLPETEARASMLQLEAKAQWENLQLMPLIYRKMGFTQRLVDECYRAAHRELLRCIYYRGMREANRD